MTILSRIVNRSKRQSPGLHPEAGAALRGRSSDDQVAVSYRVREASHTIWRAAGAAQGSLDDAATRLRSWAAIRECRPAGPPFVRFGHDGSLAVHLPIERGARPHPETGAAMSEIPGGPVATVECTCLEAISGMAARLRERVAATAAVTGPAEFHAGPAGFSEGTLLLPLAGLPRKSVA